MENVLLVCPEGRVRELERLFVPAGVKVFISHDACEAKKLLCDMYFSLVVVEPPVSGGSARDLALQASSIAGSDVVFLALPAQAGHLAPALEKYGIYTVPQNAGAEEIGFLMRVVRTGRSRIEALEKKNMKLMSRLADERVLTRAKCILAKEKGLDEEQAHRMIEKKAMDERISLLDAARFFINGF